MFENFSVCTSKYRMYEKNHKPSSIFNVQQWLYRKTYLMNIPNTSFTSTKKVFIFWKPKAMQNFIFHKNIRGIPSCEDFEDLCDWRNSQWQWLLRWIKILVQMYARYLKGLREDLQKFRGDIKRTKILFIILSRIYEPVRRFFSKAANAITHIYMCTYMYGYIVHNICLQLLLHSTNFTISIKIPVLHNWMRARTVHPQQTQSHSWIMLPYFHALPHHLPPP